MIKKIFCLLSMAFLLISCKNKNSIENLERKEIALLAYEAKINGNTNLSNEIEKLLIVLEKKNTENAKAQLKIWNNLLGYYTENQYLASELRANALLPQVNEVFGIYFTEDNEDKKYIALSNDFVVNRGIDIITETEVSKPVVSISITPYSKFITTKSPQNKDGNEFFIRRIYNEKNDHQISKIDYFYEKNRYKTKYYDPKGEYIDTEYTPFEIPSKGEAK